MLSIEQARKIQPELKYLPDEEVLDMLRDLYGLGELAFEKWHTMKSSKNPVRVLLESN